MRSSFFGVLFESFWVSPISDLEVFLFELAEEGLFEELFWCIRELPGVFIREVYPGRNSRISRSPWGRFNRDCGHVLRLETSCSWALSL